MSNNLDWEVQRALFTQLTANAPLMAQLTGVFDFVPENTALPYLTLGEQSAADWSTKSFSGQEYLLTLHVWSAARGRKQAKEIISLVHGALHQTELTITGHHLVNLRFVSSQLFLDEDGLTHHGVMRFRARIHPQ
jgi:hypothetical protein